VEAARRGVDFPLYFQMPVCLLTPVKECPFPGVRFTTTSEPVGYHWSDHHENRK
jgi:hypothetical protein